MKHPTIKTMYARGVVYFAVICLLMIGMAILSTARAEVVDVEMARIYAAKLTFPDGGGAEIKLFKPIPVPYAECLAKAAIMQDTFRAEEALDAEQHGVADHAPQSVALCDRDLISVEVSHKLTIVTVECSINPDTSALECP